MRNMTDPRIMMGGSVTPHMSCGVEFSFEDITFGDHDTDKSSSPTRRNRNGRSVSVDHSSLVHGGKRRSPSLPHHNNGMKRVTSSSSMNPGVNRTRTRTTSQDRDSRRRRRSSSSKQQQHQQQVVSMARSLDGHAPNRMHKALHETPSKRQSHSGSRCIAVGSVGSDVVEVTPPQPPQKHAVFIHGVDVITAGSILRKAVEARCGTIRAHHFREKQSFGFLEFVEPETVDKCIEALNQTEVDSVIITVERCTRVTPGRDPRLQDSNCTLHRNPVLVIKNLPFTLKEENLLEILNTLPILPQHVSFHHDANGSFRGMAFAKYNTADEASAIFDTISGMDIEGRKVRVEYKMKAKEPDKKEEEEERKLHEQLVLFRDNAALTELAFPPSLTPSERRQIHQSADKLQLTHYSIGEEDTRYVVVSKKPPPAMDPTLYSSRGIAIKGKNEVRDRGRSWGGRGDAWTGYPASMSSSGGHTSAGSAERWMRTESLVRDDMSIVSNHRARRDIRSYSATSATAVYHSYSSQVRVGTNRSGFVVSGSTSRSLTSGGSPTRQVSAVQPMRQPRGPDGSSGFAGAYRMRRLSSPQRAKVSTSVSPPTLSPRSPMSVHSNAPATVLHQTDAGGESKTHVDAAMGSDVSTLGQHKALGETVGTVSSALSDLIAPLGEVAA